MGDEKEFGALLTCSMKALKDIISEFIIRDDENEYNSIGS